MTGVQTCALPICFPVTIRSVTHDTYFWDWGDCFEYRVANVVDFSAWLSEQEFSDEDVEALKNDGKHVLIRLIDEFNSQLEETDE